MTPMERIMATIKGDKKDRVPVVPLLSLYGAKLTGCPLQRYFTLSEEYVKGQIEINNTFEPDVLFGPFSLALEGLAMGSQIKYYDKQPPNIFKPAFKTSDDFFKSNPLNWLKSEPNNYFLKAISELSNIYKNEIPIAGITLSPIDLPIMGFGIEKWLEIVLFNHSLAIKIIKSYIFYFIEKTNSLFDAGASFIVLPVAFANPSIVTKEIARQLISEIIIDAFSKVNGPIIIHSGGAKLLPFLEYFKDIPNVAGFIIHTGENLVEAREKIGESKILDGNIGGPEIDKMEKGELYNMCKDTLNIAKNDTHFILGTSAADIPYDSKIEIIKEMKQASMDSRDLGFQNA